MPLMMTLSSPAFALALLSAIIMTLVTPAISLADLDKSSQEALDKTQALLRDPTQRNAAIQGNKDANRNQQGLESLLGAGNTGGAYDLSAEVFEKLVKECNGDIVCLQMKVEEAQKSPESFAKKYFDANQQARLKQMADQAGGSSGNTRKP